VLASLIATSALSPGAATAKLHHPPLKAFHPRIGNAMGVVPPIGSQDVAVGSVEQVVFHGGAVMRDVTVHTVFWAPASYAFTGAPPAGLSYVQMIQRFFTDVAHDSGSGSSVFKVLPQYGDGSGAGGYSISYDAATDSVSDTTPYPGKGGQCASPGGIATCVTDSTIQHELGRVIRTTGPAGRGLHDLWFVFLPPNVDSCDTPGDCGTNAFAGYHSLSNLGSGPMIYSLVVDPSIEQVPPQGTAPGGNPEAEQAIDVATHETLEAITDPEGTGWMDPDGNEVGDKCGNEVGTPLGYAPNGSPYNQLINGDQYLFQMIWSNADLGCVQQSARTTSLALPPSVSLRQFSSAVSGNIGTSLRGVSVQMLLLRAGAPVAGGAAATSSSGNWRLTLRSLSGAGAAVGDDRDVILIRYGRGGPAPEAIATGSPGNPFTAAGFTGWFDLDNGYQVNPASIQLSPCFQVGVLAITVGGAPTQPPVQWCNGDTAVATVTTPRLGIGTPILMSSADDRAPSPQNPSGALVKLTIALGEPGSVPAIINPDVPFGGSGFPLCVADLRTQRVSCSGLVPGARYSLTRRRSHQVAHARAASDGWVRFSGFRGSPGVRGGDLLTLRNRSGHVLTALHVARLRIQLIGEENAVAGGSCQPLEYWGPPVTTPPTSPSVGNGGVAGQGTICPPRGRAAGLPVTDVAQTDDRSGGQTRTEVPSLLTTTPAQGALLYGPFVALAQTGFRAPNGSQIVTGTRVGLTIIKAGSSQAVFSSANVNTLTGTPVTGLVPGVYAAKWVVADVNGDTRTVRTRFVEQR
jgi:hypothetical protein